MREIIIQRKREILPHRDHKNENEYPITLNLETTEVEHELETARLGIYTRTPRLLMLATSEK